MTNLGDYSRQSFLGDTSAQVFASARVAIIGLGGGGSHIAQQLAHLGVGHFRLIDPQTIEPSNLNRLVGATQADVANRRPKVLIAQRMIKKIRPWAKVTPLQKEWQEVDEWIRDAHVIFGCVDGYQQRKNLEAVARRFMIPYIDIGMDVTRVAPEQFAIAGQMILSLPEKPCMRCMGFLTQDRLNREENNYGDAGVNPQVVWTNGALASLAVGTFVRLLCPWYKIDNECEWLELDGNQQVVCKSRQPEYSIKGPCKHFTKGDLGDPFFDIRADVLPANVAKKR